MGGGLHSYPPEPEDNIQTQTATPLRDKLTKQLLLKDRNNKITEKTGETPQPPGKTKTEPLLKYQHQDWMLKE
jgi:hypothetical protein